MSISSATNSESSRLINDPNTFDFNQRILIEPIPPPPSPPPPPPQPPVQQRYEVASKVCFVASCAFMIAAIAAESVDYNEKDSDDRLDTLSIAFNFAGGLFNAGNYWLHRRAYNGHPPEQTKASKIAEYVSNVFILPALAGGIVDRIPSTSLQVSQIASLISISSDSLSLLSGIASEAIDWVERRSDDKFSN